MLDGRLREELRNGCAGRATAPGFAVAYDGRESLGRACEIAGLLDADAVPIEQVAHLGGRARTRGRVRRPDAGGAQDPVSSEARLALAVGPGGLSLLGAGMELMPDLVPMARRLRPELLSRELLVRAAGLPAPGEGRTAVDATAGLGEDALLMAAAGYRVLLCERDPVIFLLLQDSLDRACGEAALAEAVGRMEAACVDSVQALGSLSSSGDRPDLVFLDPMFPGRQKSASVKKKLQLLQMLEAPEDREELLLDAALRTAGRRVVVKRPAKGPLLAGVAPAHTVAGKAVRFDCLVPRA